MGGKKTSVRTKSLWIDSIGSHGYCVSSEETGCITSIIRQIDFGISDIDTV